MRDAEARGFIGIALLLRSSSCLNGDAFAALWNPDGVGAFRDSDRAVIENTERLRHKIDSGRTGDKVPGSDPTVASLGTDDEAAGRPPRPHEIASTRHRETGRPHESHDHPGLGHAWILVAFTLLLAMAIIVWTAAVHSSPRQVHAASVSVITSVPAS
jgi:hypothetical protein